MTFEQKTQNSCVLAGDAVLTNSRSQKTESTESRYLTTWTKTRTSLQIGKGMCDITYPGFQHQRTEKCCEKGVEESNFHCFPLLPSISMTPNKESKKTDKNVEKIWFISSVSIYYCKGHFIKNLTDAI